MKACCSEDGEASVVHSVSPGVVVAERNWPRRARTWVRAKSKSKPKSRSATPRFNSLRHIDQTPMRVGSSVVPAPLADWPKSARPHTPCQRTSPRLVCLSPEGHARCTCTPHSFAKPTLGPTDSAPSASRRHCCSFALCHNPTPTACGDCRHTAANFGHAPLGSRFFITSTTRLVLQRILSSLSSGTISRKSSGSVST